MSYHTHSMSTHLASTLCQATAWALGTGHHQAQSLSSEGIETLSQRSLGHEPRKREAQRLWTQSPGWGGDSGGVFRKDLLVVPSVS